MTRKNIKEEQNANHVIRQDTQCMYNITLRHVHATTVAVEKS